MKWNQYQVWNNNIKTHITLILFYFIIIGKPDITKLKSAGFHTIESIAHAKLSKLTDVKGISEQKANKLKDTIKANRLVCLGFQSATGKWNFIIFVDT